MRLGHGPQRITKPEVDTKDTSKFDLEEINRTKVRASSANPTMRRRDIAIVSTENSHDTLAIPSKSKTASVAESRLSKASFPQRPDVDNIESVDASTAVMPVEEIRSSIANILWSKR